MNKSLPIYTYRREIIDAVLGNKVVIVTAETGAGKSTQVPQYVMQAFSSRVLVTQPRRLAARTVAERIAEETRTTLGKEIGYRTRYESKVSNETRCLFVTDGIGLSNVLSQSREFDVLILDEVHEWNLNVELMVAMVRDWIKTHPRLKVVLMSATLDAGALSRFFDDAPVISVPGRTFPVEERKPGKSMTDDAVTLLREGRNVLIFEPGKDEIYARIEEIKKTGVVAKVLGLHGGMDADEQALCFADYAMPLCVVATNVAQTSITIECIDAVIDSGMERRNEVENGIVGLYLRSISLADAAQRKGRAGRTKPGIYIDHCPEAQRYEYAVPEIMRVPLETTVLNLAKRGIDLETLHLFHQPSMAQIHQAKIELSILGCLSDTGSVTEKGFRISELPVSVQSGCMLLEAERRGCVEDVLTLIAIMEAGDFTLSMKDESGYRMYPWHSYIGAQRTSDLMAMLKLYELGQGQDYASLRSIGIHGKQLRRVSDLRKQLSKLISGKIRHQNLTVEPEETLICVLAGMLANVCVHQYDGYRCRDGAVRQLHQGSVIRSLPKLMMAKPWNLEIKTMRGNQVLNLLTFASVIELNWLYEIAPELIEIRSGLSPFIGTDDECYSHDETWIGGILYDRKVVQDPHHPMANSLHDEKDRKLRNAERSKLLSERERLAGELHRLTIHQKWSRVDVELRRKISTVLLPACYQKDLGIDEIHLWLDRADEAYARAIHEMHRPEPIQKVSGSDLSAGIAALQDKFGSKHRK